MRNKRVKYIIGWKSVKGRIKVPSTIFTVLIYKFLSFSGILKMSIYREKRAKKTLLMALLLIGEKSVKQEQSVIYSSH